MATHDTWMQPLQARLSGATPGQIKTELNSAIREFYLQSRAWVTQLGPLPVNSGVSLVPITPAALTRVVFVRSVWLQDPARGESILRPLTGRRTDGVTGYPTHYSIDENEPTTIRLWPTPDATLGNVLWADVSITPLENAATLPNVAATLHYDAILAGSLARLFQLPNKPWTDLMQAGVNARAFRRHCIEFRSLSDQGYAHADKGWRFPPFA